MRKVILSVAVVVIMGTMLVSCKGESKKVEPVEEVALTEYQCPMKCEGDKTYTDKDTKCPVCNMALVAVEHEIDSSEHDH